jgi:hypothetical protein
MMEFLLTLSELDGQVTNLLFVMVIVFASVVERCLQVFDFVFIFVIIFLGVV